MRWRSAICSSSRRIMLPIASTTRASCARGPIHHSRRSPTACRDWSCGCRCCSMPSSPRAATGSTVRRMDGNGAGAHVRPRRPKGSIAIGADADICVWDPKRRTTISDAGPRCRRLHALCRARRSGLAGDRAQARRGDRRRRQAQGVGRLGPIPAARGGLGRRDRRGASVRSSTRRETSVPSSIELHGDRNLPSVRDRQLLTP